MGRPGLLGRAVRWPLHLIPAGAVVRAPAGPLRGLRWMPASMAHGAWLGRVEPVQLNELLRRLHTGGVVWDVGANVGLYTLPASRRVGASGHVYAFEPMARNLDYLCRHARLNALTNITIVEAAVGATTGRVRMAPGDFPAEYHVDDGGRDEVQAITLDEWQRDAGARLPDIVKVDVEGAEEAVLHGGVRSFAAARPTLFLSLHGERQREACRVMLEAWRYDIVSLDPALEVRRSSDWLATPR